MEQTGRTRQKGHMRRKPPLGVWCQQPSGLWYLQPAGGHGQELLRLLIQRMLSSATRGQLDQPGRAAACQAAARFGGSRGGRKHSSWLAVCGRQRSPLGLVVLAAQAAVPSIPPWVGQLVVLEAQAAVPSPALG